MYTYTHKHKLIKSWETHFLKNVICPVPLMVLKEILNLTEMVEKPVKQRKDFTYVFGDIS